MSEAIISRRCNNGVKLNYTVVGGTIQPSNPTENTIWINTNIEIISHSFSINRPENPVEGMVWIKIGLSSSAEFNALKDNEINIYPILAKQYINNEWIDKIMNVYKNKIWIGMDFVLLGYDGFDSNIIVADKYDINGYHTSYTIGNNYVSLWCYHSGSYGSWLNLSFDKKYDLTDFSSIEITVEDVGDSISAQAIYIGSSYGARDIAYRYFDGLSGTYMVDISNVSGSCYISLYVQPNANAQSYMTVTSLKLMRV